MHTALETATLVDVVRFLQAKHALTNDQRPMKQDGFWIQFQSQEGMDWI